MLKKLLQSLGFGKKTARQDKPIGEVTHYYNHLNVAILRFDQPVSVGQKITVQGHTTDFSQTIDSMQVDHASVQSAPKGKEVGIKIKEKVRQGDKVYKD